MKTCLIGVWKITGEGEMADAKRKKKKVKNKITKYDLQAALQVIDVKFCLTRHKEETDYDKHVNYFYFFPWFYLAGRFKQLIA